MTREARKRSESECEATREGDLAAEVVKFSQRKKYVYDRQTMLKYENVSDD